MDLSLALVEDDLGHAVSLAVARELVLFLRRPGSQAQFSSALQAQAAQSPELRELQGWIADHLDADLSVGALAERVSMSPR
ncbi:GlxA family transcriptional regulator, partial [Salmonella enterica]|nr:GlxA family transcriptional regulator [Salmonella enterica]